MVFPNEERVSERRALINILDANGIKLKKSLGQNFLFRSAVIDYLSGLVNLSKDDLVIEVGCGIGALSLALAERLRGGAGELLLIEIDKRFAAILEDRLRPFDNVTLLQADALELDWAELDIVRRAAAEGRRLHIVSNLPYYITGELIENFLLKLPDAYSMSFMMQDEAYKRIGNIDKRNKNLSPLAVLWSLYGDVQAVEKLSKEEFYPVPGVDSVFVSIRKKSAACATGVSPEQIPGFNAFLKMAFAERRKTLKNNLRSLCTSDTWQELCDIVGILYDVRAEALSPQQLAELYLAWQNLSQ